MVLLTTRRAPVVAGECANARDGPAQGRQQRSVEREVEAGAGHGREAEIAASQECAGAQRDRVRIGLIGGGGDVAAAERRGVDHVERGGADRAIDGRRAAIVAGERVHARDRAVQGRQAGAAEREVEAAASHGGQCQIRARERRRAAERHHAGIGLVAGRRHAADVKCDRINHIQRGGVDRAIDRGRAAVIAGERVHARDGAA